MKLVLARKKHYCSFCHNEIKKGTRYWRDYAETADGYPIRDTKQHVNCAEHEAKVTAQLSKKD